ncbi:hypothetical protein LTSERUB_3014 [Salmonella enterica subsp. enterica serovar Rubislaw str. A4-653]|uniref:Uncharacterized protein n=1 Tax=Salmonella enterica subsp. enterica serovar Rubislaw str. A4-653 TaxID=913081 RepID=G5QK36_SALRU|nr:hypothetical protein LTSERUB_3014 [Salmonella enterica subsp. enterica serovar Rubislaw str. A4-653]
MVAKNKIHGRRIHQSLQQLHQRCLFQQLAVSPPGTKYVSVTAVTAETKNWLISVTAETKNWLIHLVTSEGR